MKTTLFAAALLTSAVAGTPAAAADFAGPRAEVTLGVDRVNFDLGAYGTDGRTRAHGLTYGGAVGYDVPLGGTLVAGVEAGINFSSSHRDFNDGTNAVSLDSKHDLELSARLGGRIAPRTLLYGKAGYTNMRIGGDGTLAAVAVNDRADLDGYRLGVGLEQGLSGKSYVKTEYRYSNYEHDVSKNEVLAGVGIRF